VTVAELQAYLDANQLQDPAAEPTAPGDLARVKSRLFDDFLNGEILLQEAQRRGITVSDEELASIWRRTSRPRPTRAPRCGAI
jgi:hypothetical protein